LSDKNKKLQRLFGQLRPFNPKDQEIKKTVEIKGHHSMARHLQTQLTSTPDLFRLENRSYSLSIIQRAFHIQRN
jgi:hypothetical protein